MEIDIMESKVNIVDIPTPILTFIGTFMHKQLNYLGQ